jgi:hypothetical protein
MGNGRFCMVNRDGVPPNRDGVPVNKFFVNALSIDHLPSPMWICPLVFGKLDIPFTNADVHMGDGRFCIDHRDGVPVNRDGVPPNRDGVPVNKFLVNALSIDHLPSPIAHVDLSPGIWEIGYTIYQC